MVEVTYYVAMSLDGFIARSDGSVDWLARVEKEGEDYGYTEFFASVDGLLMGGNTYRQVESYGQWPYGDKPCWVWTHRTITPAATSIRATDEPPLQVIQMAADLGLKHLWLVGGGLLAEAFHREKAITRYVLSVIPVILGQGIPLLRGSSIPADLVLESSETFTGGIVQLVFAPEPAP
ncbi:MAG: dihydrofolate reductase family protein [Xanthomonadales bacterium]|nr:dihydrofolate reductase family protein [Xanthomonadales bacterium]